MNVFTPYPDPLETAKCLDKRRLWKQIIECRQILDVLRGKSEAWMNHPISKMYLGYDGWLESYLECLVLYREGNLEGAQEKSIKCLELQPPFLTDDYCDNMKRRLYTKAPDLYPQFSEYGESYLNMYFVGGVWKYYQQKKK